MISTREPLCLYCRRYLPETENPPRCGAFPQGIPDDIFDGIISHTASERGEPTFLGSIPVGWETRGPEPDYDDNPPTWAGQTQKGEGRGEVRVVRD